MILGRSIEKVNIKCCFPMKEETLDFMQLLEILFFVDFPRSLFFYLSIFYLFFSKFVTQFSQELFKKDILYLVCT